MRTTVRLHPHARERLAERGAAEEEVIATVLEGERFLARFGRTEFRRNFAFHGQWRGRGYQAKQLEVYAVAEDKTWLVITVIVKYFRRKESRTMRLTYDPRHNIAYLRLREKTLAVKTIRVSDEINIDIAPDGAVYGIELLNANAQLLGADGGRLVVVDEAAGEEQAIPLGR